MRLLFLLLLLPLLAHGMAGIPPADMGCKEEPFPNPSTQYIHCWFPPHISKFVTAADEVAFPSALVIPRKPPGKVKIVAHFDGYNPRPFGQCDNYGFSDPAALVTKNCPEPTDGTHLHWGGPQYGENAYGWRIAATAKYATDNYPAIIDLQAGITLQGCSYGGTTAILQSILMPDSWTKALLTVVDACVPNTMMTEQTPPVGMYWKNAAVRKAWGSYDWTQADIRKASGRVYYKLVGSPVDNLVVFDTRVFPTLDAQHIPNFGLWHNAGHVQGIVEANLPWFDTYPCAGMAHRLDSPQVAFSNSSANTEITAPIGYWNLGLCYLNAGMIDTPTRTVIPIRYLRWTAIAVDVPDQPESVTFDVTIRNTKLQLHTGDIVHYALNGESGEALVLKDGEATIMGLTLQSSSTYTTLTVTK